MTTMEVKNIQNFFSTVFDSLTFSVKLGNQNNSKHNYKWQSLVVTLAHRKWSIIQFFDPLSSSWMRLMRQN
jgi:hypothetical protein